MKSPVAAAMICVSAIAFASAATAGEGYLTRFGPETYKRERGKPTNHSATFKAIAGPAELILQDKGIVNARIEINGVSVVDRRDFRGYGEIVIPVQLEDENTIEVSVRGRPRGRLGVRVVQHTVANFEVRAKVYFGLNTSDMETQRVFYTKLGLLGEIFPAGPEQCRTFARSLGFEDDYLIFVALTSFNGFPPWVDTVQFREESFRDEPPYERLNHIGMAYSTYSTSDLDGAYAFLKGEGIEFVSRPTTARNGERFVFLKDQDGAFLKLIEDAAGVPPNPGAPNLVKLVNTNMNVADLERSVEFYRMLGFTEEAPGSQVGWGPFARAHGFKWWISFKGLDLSLPGPDPALPPAVGDPEATLQLRQWKFPFDDEPPYPPPVNHLGIDRIAFYVDDLTAVVEEMNRLGFEQLGPIGGGTNAGDIGIVFFLDPDGIKVEFWGPVSEPNPDAGC